MSDIKQSDILVDVGGYPLQRYGALSRRLTVASRNGEAAKETVTRSNTGLAINADGKYSAFGAAIPRVAFQSALAYLVQEGARTNLVVQSDAITAAVGWTVGAITATANYVSMGASNLTRLQGINGDEAYRTVGLTGDARKSVSWVVQFDGVAGLTHHTLFDNTAGVHRARAEVTWAADGTATCTAQNGTLLAFTALYNHAYLIEMQSTTCTAANTHYIFASTSGGTTATSVRVGLINVNDAMYPTASIATTTVTVTRGADLLYVPFVAGPIDISIYASLLRPLWADATFTGVDHALCSLGAVGGGSAYVVLGAPDGTGDNWAITALGATASAAVPAGASLDLSAQVKNISTGPQVALDVGSGLSAFTSAGNSFSAYSDTKCYVGNYNSGAAPMNAALRRLLIVRGLHSLAELRAVG